MFLNLAEVFSEKPMTNIGNSTENYVALSNISRRKFLQGSGIFVLGVALAPNMALASEAVKLTDAGGADASPGLWIAIDKDDSVIVTCHRSEMGQQVWTAMAQIVADELEANWDNIVIKQATGDAMYGDQNTDGSRSVRFNFQRLRLAGAAMRTMLERAAAKQWGVDVNRCTASNGYVQLKGSQEKLSYGALADSAKALPVPKKEDITLKTRKQWRYIGKPVSSLTVPKILKGEGRYGIDVDRPDMLYAVVARPPQLFGKMGKVDNKKALAVPGVVNTVILPELTPPAIFKPLGGVAVVAKDTWAAIQGRRALQVEWLDGPNASYNSAEYRQKIENTARKKGTVKRTRGDVNSALKQAHKALEAEYYVPHFAQSPMEPPSATAQWDGDQLTVWAAVQDPQNTRNVLGAILGIDISKITVHPTWLGGAFGRKSKPDFVVEAAIIAKQIGKPIKVTWTREDDLKHGYYHSVSAQKFAGGLDKDGNCTAFLHRTVFPPIPSTFDNNAKEPSPLELGLGASDNPFDVPNFQLEAGAADAHVRIGWMRSVSNIYHAFGIQGFANELAYAAGQDPKDYLLKLIGKPRFIDPTKEGAADFFNYDAPLADYPIDTGRLANAAKVAADMAGWGRSLPKGHGLGIAVHRSFLTYVATAIEVKVDASGELSIPGVWLAVDAGTVVNTRHVKAQMEGGTLYGLSCALFGEITVKNGVIEQNNFPDWRVLRMPDAPQAFDVKIIESDAAPAGVGEPGTPPAAPALTNAIFAATGKRIRQLPILGPKGQKLDLNS